jgi:hypothetical protein
MRSGLRHCQRFAVIDAHAVGEVHPLAKLSGTSGRMKIATGRAPLKVKEVWVQERRHVVCLNEEERRKDAHDREGSSRI